MEESANLRKTRLLTQLLLVSITLNVGLLATFLYRAVTPVELTKAAPVAKEQVFEVSNGEMIYSYFHCSFADLVGKLNDERLVEEGYRVCDLALACLVSYHHFDLERALPSARIQSRHLLFVHVEGGEQIDIPVFPGLLSDDFVAIASFAQREQWPLTAKGLYYKLLETSEESLKEAFMLTSPFITAHTLFNREGISMGKEEVLALLLEGSWKLCKRIDQEKIFTREQQLELLSEFVNQGSVLAGQCLLRHAREYAVRKLPDQTLAKLVSLSEDEALHKEVASGVRSDSVRQVAQEKLGSAPVREESPNIHIVKKGDTLWHIARKYEISIKKIQELNKLKDQDRIYPGKELIVSP